MKNMSVKQAQDLEKDAVKKEKKSEAKAEKDKKEKAVSYVHNTRHHGTRDGEADGTVHSWVKVGWYQNGVF